MRLSDQAVGAIMMALQNSLMNQTDILPIFEDFKFQLDENEQLIVLNPPTVNVPEELANVVNEKNNTVGSD